MKLHALSLSLALAAAPLHAQEIEVLRQKIFAAIERDSAELIKISDAIWRHAETSLEEVRSSEELAGLLSSRGFTVKRGIAGMPTAFIASFGKGSPVIGILGEFDALPGISNQILADFKNSR